VSSYFKPASECGGDWWGSMRLGDKLVLLIGDATGHGVPAALITAAAHSCATTLSHLSERIPALALSPVFILDCLNAAICQAGRGRVKMTFFVAVLDGVTGEMRYANASHDLPVIYRGSAQEDADAAPSKEHLDSLGQKPDPCLGESLETRFSEHATVLAPADTMLLFTDGLIECRNNAEEEYGERRLLRSFLTVAQASAEAIKDGLVAKALGFFEKPAHEDDITLVVVKRDRAAAEFHRAG
jgi:sigma-B regulation protein RsbU (phosphoserine phosphatase)